MSTFSCPMHPEIKQDHKGRCPICGMALVLTDSEPTLNTPHASYKPLYTVIALIGCATFALGYQDVQNGSFTVSNIITYFMTGFFLVFGGFKLLDISGFVDGFATYDLVAQKIRLYATLYPFIEVGFGLGMILYPHSVTLIQTELIVMTISGVGVAIKLAKKEKFRCMCLGTIFKIPLTNVTLIENFGMTFLALLLLLLK